MKKAITLAGPAAALIAFKCPVCLLALAGISAGVGSLMPLVNGAYWAIIVGLAALFLWFLYRQRKLRGLPIWILGLGVIGVSALIYQVATEADGIISWIPAITLSVASISSFFTKNSTTQASCCENRAASNQKLDLHLSPGASPTMESKESKTMAKRKVEVFTSGCPLCEPVVELVKKTACSSCEVVIYDLNAGCDTNECRDKAKKYGVTRVPAVAVNGKLLDCCKTGTVTEQALRAAGVGSA